MVFGLATTEPGEQPVVLSLLKLPQTAAKSAPTIATAASTAVIAAAGVTPVVVMTVAGFAIPADVLTCHRSGIVGSGVTMCPVKVFALSEC